MPARHKKKPGGGTRLKLGDAGLKDGRLGGGGGVRAAFRAVRRGGHGGARRLHHAIRSVPRQEVAIQRACTPITVYMHVHKSRMTF